MRSSIATLARAAGVSKPTVNRFCHRLGARGFPDFKLQLAQGLVKASSWVSHGVEQYDDVGNYSHKIFDSALAGLQQAVTLLTQANKLAFFGLGASAVVAHDAFTKFLRFDLPVIW